MIIFGTRTRISTIDRGQFNCPRCGVQPYERKRARRFFTLYFIPLIPIGDLGEFIECSLCHGNYRTEVLQLAAPKPPEQGLEVEFKRAMLRVVVQYLPIDASPERVGAACEAYRKLTSLPVDAGQVAKEREAMKTVDAASYFGNFAKHLSPERRERLLQMAVDTAAPAERSEALEASLTSFGMLLGMTSAHVRGVLGVSAAAPA